MTESKTQSQEKLFALLMEIYGDETIAQPALEKTLARLATFQKKPQAASHPLFSEKDITLITYGDSILEENTPPLQVLHRFLNRYVKNKLSTVHILPFYPYSSDDGFSVIDYYQVNPELGDWDDVEAIGQDFRMMYDAVINHMSAKSTWFQDFLANKEDFSNLFFTALETDDLTGVTRPRTSPLLTPFTNALGETRHLWTTFSADQIDLNYNNSNTLIRILDVLLFYVERGAEVIRLDAIAYMWKEIGTNSIHRPQTHAIIRFLRAALDVVAPQVILITETNVPHPENISYFGDGYDEAQMVYNFTLPPLLFYSMVTGNATKLAAWANTLDTPSERTSYFNFTASHDGIGVRPLEGILPASELQILINAVQDRGGRVSYKRNSDGTDSPYELNITYLEAMSNPSHAPHLQQQAFLTSQAIMLSFAGVPAVYIHSLLGSRNNISGMEQTGHNRTINRAKLQYDDLLEALNDPTSERHRIYHDYAKLLEIRRSQEAFYPKATQVSKVMNNGQVLWIERGDAPNHLVCLFNVTDQTQTIAHEFRGSTDLLNPESDSASLHILEPYQTRWIKRI